MKYYLGIDFGTSGARAIAIDKMGDIRAEVERPLPAGAAKDLQRLPEVWKETLFETIALVPWEIRRALRAIAIDATSSTVLLCDGEGRPVTETLLYNDARSVETLDRVRAIAPDNHPAIAATSSLAKLLWWQQRAKKEMACYFLHQADWLAFLLHGQPGLSDYHNALKLGFDPAIPAYPDWIAQQDFFPLLPRVLVPGEPIGEILPDVAKTLEVRPGCMLCAGTTDSVAAFLASSAKEPGEAVTSLGSTLVLKLLSETRVDDARYGIYSHRLGNLWLAGGASNTGGAVLRQFFSDEELAALSDRLDAERESTLDYYPLTKPGERFPINDPDLPPCLEPRPKDPIAFLHGLLEGMARIEALGYQKLQELGATPLKQAYAAGGGASNLKWMEIRARHLRVPLLLPIDTRAAYGAALLAVKGIRG